MVCQGCVTDTWCVRYFLCSHRNSAFWLLSSVSTGESSDCLLVSRSVSEACLTSSPLPHVPLGHQRETLSPEGRRGPPRIPKLLQLLMAVRPKAGNLHMPCTPALLTVVSGGSDPTSTAPHPPRTGGKAASTRAGIKEGQPLFPQVLSSGDTENRKAWRPRGQETVSCQRGLVTQTFPHWSGRKCAGESWLIT